MSVEHLFEQGRPRAREADQETWRERCVLRRGQRTPSCIQRRFGPALRHILQIKRCIAQIDLKSLSKQAIALAGAVRSWAKRNSLARASG